jgi:DNA topoisomerase-1
MHYVTGSEPGLRRVGRAPRFRYLDEITQRAAPADAVARAKRLAIPPAWTDVWISADPQAHIQAWGRDAKGRKQYRYHPDFRAHNEQTKFDQLLTFAHCLGHLRCQIDADMRHPTLDHDRVVAAVTSLLDRTLLRVGNEEYARTNGSYGLTTLRTNHVAVTSTEIAMRFVGKSGHRFDVHVHSPRLARIVRRCQELPGQVLFQYETADGDVRPVGSNDVNEYLRRHTGVEATAKTFRTWGASTLAAEILAATELPASAREATRVLNASVDEVAAQLGNTRAVCRRSYVHPVVVERFLDGTLPDVHRPAKLPDARWLSDAERRLAGVLAAAAG